jgi:hypothetical protein
MKNFILIVIIFIVSFSAVNAQPKKMTDELKKIRKEKYLENVSVDDATADRYFELFDENFLAVKKLSKQKKENMEYIEKNIEAADVSARIEEILDIDSKIVEKKKDLYTQLKTFLSPKQIAQSIIFQLKFNKELKNQIDKRKDKRRKEER